MKRAWILFEDGTKEELPENLIDFEEITWPPTLHVMEPGEAVHYFRDEELYRRHEVIQDTACVFMRDSQAGKEVPPAFVEEIVRLLKP